MRDEPIAKELDDLLRIEDILNGEVEKQNMISVIPSRQE